MAKRKIAWRLNSALLDRLDERCRKENRRQISIIEQALAEYLNVPLANRELPEQPVEICGNCEKGVLDDRLRCADCGWHRLTRQDQWARDRQARAAKERARKLAERAKEAA